LWVRAQSGQTNDSVSVTSPLITQHYEERAKTSG
jgi:hypothetical protein